MLELLSLLMFYKNKHTFSESKSFPKEREEKTKKKKNVKKKRKNGGKTHKK